MARKAGHLKSVQGLKRFLQDLPATLAHEVAKRAAPEMTRLTRSAFDSARTVYGDPRPLSKVTGDRLSLYRSGAVLAGLRFVSIGTITRCVLGPSYAKYLIGHYQILPNGALPFAWVRKLGDIVAEVKGPATAALKRAA